YRLQSQTKRRRPRRPRSRGPRGNRYWRARSLAERGAKSRSDLGLTSTSHCSSGRTIGAEGCSREGEGGRVEFVPPPSKSRPPQWSQPPAFRWTNLRSRLAPVAD